MGHLDNMLGLAKEIGLASRGDKVIPFNLRFFCTELNSKCVSEPYFNVGDELFDFLKEKLSEDELAMVYRMIRGFDKPMPVNEETMDIEQAWFDNLKK